MAESWAQFQETIRAAQEAAAGAEGKGDDDSKEVGGALLATAPVLTNLVGRFGPEGFTQNLIDSARGTLNDLAESASGYLNDAASSARAMLDSRLADAQDQLASMRDSMLARQEVGQESLEMDDFTVLGSDAAASTTGAEGAASTAADAADVAASTATAAGDAGEAAAAVTAGDVAATTGELAAEQAGGGDEVGAAILGLIAAISGIAELFSPPKHGPIEQSAFDADA